MRSERGFVSVAVVGLAAVVLAISAVVATLASVAVARHRAASAADLAALAGAQHALEGQQQACQAAARSADRQGAALDSCSLDGDQVSVVVRVRLGSLGSARARARAGPVRGGNP
jgi:secretion/DNA translocation related TadE-like protein